MGKNKKWNDNPSLSNKLGDLFSYNAELKKDNLGNERKLKISVTCKQSKELKSKFFTNKIKTTDMSILINNYIVEILEFDGKEIESDRIPFIPNGTLSRNINDTNRINDILELYNKKFEDDKIMKCLYNNKSTYQKNKGDLLRIFTKMSIDSEVEVILIDPHHLVATENYQDIFKKLKGKCNHCYSSLKKFNIFE